MGNDKKPKKKSHHLYAIVVIILAIAIVALGIFVLFYVQDIEVEGNEYITDREVIDVVENDELSVNSLYILGKYKLGYGEVLPCFESMKISLKNPWTVLVTVEEKPMVGYVINESDYSYFDKEGLVVVKSNNLVEGLPCIEGVEITNSEQYEKVKSEDTRTWETILEISKEAKRYNLTAKKITYRDGMFYLYTGNVCVSLGTSVSSDKIAQVPAILEKLEEQVGTLHLENYSETKETITFSKDEIPEEN